MAPENEVMRIPGWQEHVETLYEKFHEHLPDIRLVDKYPQATVNAAMSEAMHRMFKRHNGSIKKADLRRMRLYAIERIRPTYGAYANVLDVRIKTRGLSFDLNFDAIYKSPEGRLYGRYILDYRNFFLYTTHALERLEQRTDFSLLRCLVGRDLTALDIAPRISKVLLPAKGAGVMLTSYGYFILDEITDWLSVVKTFVTYDMTTTHTKTVNDFLEGIEGKDNLDKAQVAIREFMKESENEEKESKDED